MEEAAYLIEGRPPGDWDVLVTKEYLDLRVDALRSEINSFRHELRASLEHELRALGWKVAGGLIAGLATFGAVIRF